MAETSRTPLLAKLFWIVACCSLLLVLIPAAQEWNHPGGEFSGLAVITLLALAVLLALIVIIVALIRKPLAYGIGLAFLSMPLLAFVSQSALNVAVRMAAPSDADLASGRGYFRVETDRALAEAIVAGNAAKVVALAPAAHLDAVGWDNMTFMQLALQNDQPNRDVLGALLRAGIDPDENASALWALIYREKDEALLRLVIDSGVDLNRKMGQGSWYLFMRYDWPEEQVLLLDHGVNTEVRDLEGYTPLMRAAQAKSWPTVKALLAHGARTDPIGNDGKSLRDLMPEGLPTSPDADLTRFVPPPPHP
jgi:hypothetical protein